MKIYSGVCCLGVCGTGTEMYDDYCEWEELEGHDNFKAVPNLCVGDQVVAVVRDAFTNTARDISGVCVVVEREGRKFIMGLASIDFTSENDERKEWMIKKIKSWSDCVDGERVPDSAQIRYVGE